MAREPRRLDLRLLVPVLVAWPVTAFAALVVPVPLGGVGAVLAAAGAVVLVSARRRRRPLVRLAALTLAAIALCSTSAVGQRAVQAAGPLDELAVKSAVVTLRGVVASEPRVLAARPNEEGKDPEPRILLRVAVSEVTGRGRTSAQSAPVLVTGGAEWQHIPWRSEVEFTGRLRPAVPGDDVIAVVTAKDGPRQLSEPGRLYRVADAVRARFRDATEHLPADARGLVPALVIGDTSRNPPDLTEAMLETGMSHLSAVSGSNVTLVLGAAMGLCQVLMIRRRLRPWVALGVLVAFVILARPEPSVIRAAVMGGVGLLGLTVERRRAGVPALAAAMIALIAWDPWLSRSFGFALSSVATLGLLVLAGPWGAAISRRLPARLAWLGPVLAVPVAAQAVCAPIVVPLQASVSLIAVPANLLAAPLVAPTTIVGVTVALVSVVWVGGASVIAWGAGVPALGIAWVARACAEAPYGSIAWGESPLAAVLLAVVTVLVVGVSPWLWHHSRLRPLLAVAAVMLLTAAALPTSLAGWPPPGWLVVACDVGQGDGLVINNGGGHAVVVDTGPEPAAMDRCLRRLRVEVVDVVVLTHFHADHSNGLEGVLDGWPVDQVLVSPVREPEHEADEVDRLTEARGIPLGELRAGDTLTVGGFHADVWWPARTLHSGSVSNNGSIVMTVRSAGVSILFTGDIEREAAAEVLRAARRDSARWGTVDVLKVPHHGSGNRDDRILDQVNGRFALISVGEDNDYGHPAPSALIALERKGFRILRTDLEGDVAIVRTTSGLRAVPHG